MARSGYIYIVTCGDGPVAAFTVKHELQAWLNRPGRTYHRDLEVTRHRDAYPDVAPVVLNPDTLNPAI